MSEATTTATLAAARPEPLAALPALAAAMLAYWQQREQQRNAYAAVGSRPEVLAAVTRASSAAAKRFAAMGSVESETEARTIDALAATVAAHGWPDDDALPILLKRLARRAAAAAKQQQGRQWQPTIRAAAPTDAPNRMEAWSDTALIDHASRYTYGDLRGSVATDEQRAARASVAALMRLAGWQPLAFAVTARDRAQAVIDARAEAGLTLAWRLASVERPVGVADDGSAAVAVTAEAVGPYLGASSAHGGTVPSAEATYWRAAQAWNVAEAFRAAVGVERTEALAAAYVEPRYRKNKRGGRVGETLRPAGVRWQRAAVAVGVDRGTLAREAKRSARGIANIETLAARSVAARLIDAARWQDAYRLTDERPVTFYAARSVATVARPLPWNQNAASNAVGSRANPPRPDAGNVAEPLASAALRSAQAWNMNHDWQRGAVLPFAYRNGVSAAWTEYAALRAAWQARHASYPLPLPAQRGPARSGRGLPF